MVDRAGSNLLNFDTGITRILTQNLESTSQLPGKARLAPTDARAMNIMNRLLDAKNVQAMLQQGLTPTVSDRDVLQPHKFMDAVGLAKKDVEARIADAKMPEEKEALKALLGQLETVEEFHEEFEAYANALIGG